MLGPKALLGQTAQLARRVTKVSKVYKAFRESKANPALVATRWMRGQSDLFTSAA